MAILNNNWFNLNSIKRYPIDDKATGESDVGLDIPNDIVVDVRLRFPETTAKFAAISSIHCGPGIVTVTFLGCQDYPVNTGELDAEPQFIPLAVISIPKPVLVGIPYSLTPMTDGVMGWIVFGEGVEQKFSATFTNTSQAIIAPRAASPYTVAGVSSISINNNEVKLKKDIKLRGLGDLDISYGEREIPGVGEVSALIFSLRNQSTSENLYKKYHGKCQGRPESESCVKTSVEYINDVYPDCYGNININFSTNQIRNKVLVNSILKGMAVEMPLGMAEACTKTDYLPDEDGDLPNKYVDECADIAASEGDPDAIAEIVDNTDANPSLMSSALEPTNLPYLDELIYADDTQDVPTHFEFVNSEFLHTTTEFNRGFPSGRPYSGMAVLSAGSRFLAVWNDLASGDHSFQKDYPESLGYGCRASVSFVAQSEQDTGAVGVVLDYCTIYSSAQSKYIKAYIIGVFNFLTRRLEIYRWGGSSWTLKGRTSPITNIVSGTWYSIDFQKDTSVVGPNSTVQYRLNMFTAADYWAIMPSPRVTYCADSALAYEGLVSIGSQTSQIIISRDSKSIYVGVINESKISLYTRDSETGALTLGGDVSAPLSVMYTCISEDGTSVYAVGTQRLEIFSRDIVTGVLTSQGTIAVSGATSLTLSMNGESLYITSATNYFGGSPINLIRAYSRNTVTGSIASIGDVSTGDTPSNSCISPDGISVYVVNSGDDTISIYSRDTVTGVLTATGTAPTGSYPYYIKMSADGRSVYVANTSSNNVSIYSRNTTTGALTAAGTIACGTGPQSLCISEDQRSVYVVNTTANTMSSYDRNLSTGGLTFNSLLATGNFPVSIAVSDDGLNVYVSNYTSSTISIYGRCRASSSFSSSMGAAADVVTPNAGYTFSLSSKSLASLNLYSEDYGGVNSLSGFGTVFNGAPIFSYFFVG